MVEVQLHISTASDLQAQVIPVKNDPRGYYRQKPKGGFWTSTWHEETHDSAWVEWCRSTRHYGMDEQHWWLLTPHAGIRLYTIDSLADFNQCLLDYGFPSPNLRLGPLFAGQRVLDFEKLAGEFDGLHLTEQGNQETHLSMPNDLYAWDCESTLWFRWCFTDVQRIAHEWLESEVQTPTK